MFTDATKQFLKQTAVMTALLTTASVAMVLVMADANAAKPPPQPLSCTVSPQGGSTDTGQAINFSADVNGGAKGVKS